MKIAPRGSLAPPITSRPYQSEADLQQMLELLMQARAATSDWRYAHVGELLFNFFMLLCHLDPCRFIRLWHDSQDRLVAYAILGEDPSLECQVLPELEWGGIEEEALAWAQQQIHDLRSSEGEKWGGDLVSGARQDDPKRITFLEQHGFRFSGEFAEVNMLRSLAESIWDAELPAGWKIRGLTESPSEISQRAEIQRIVWQPWSVGNVTDENYARFMRLPGYDPELDIIVVNSEGVVAAYVNCWIDPVNRIGDFGPVGARPEYRRMGLTRAVLAEGLRRLKAAGMERVCVSTNNDPAQRLYESIGFRVVNQYLDYVRRA